MEEKNKVKDPKKTEVKKSVKLGYSFYHNFKEYIVEASNQNEARALFYKLLEQENVKRNSKA